jgi:hypothetical protein
LKTGGSGCKWAVFVENGWWTLRKDVKDLKWLKMVGNRRCTAKSRAVYRKCALTFGNGSWYLKMLETEGICYKTCSRAQNGCWGFKRVDGCQNRPETIGTRRCIMKKCSVG